jgi:SRSO17 transposase
VIVVLCDETEIPTTGGGTIAHERRAGFLDAVMARIWGCFCRCEPRRLVREFVLGLLMELEGTNCWTIAEALGHRGPHRLQHLLSRAKWDEQQVLDQAAEWAVEHLADGGDAVLIVDETGDAKSSTDRVGAARQYSGSLGGVALCQVAVNLAYATGRGHTIIDRRLYLPKDWTFDEERRELAGVPEQIEFATKPQLAARMLTHAHGREIRAAFVAGDEVYGGRDLRACIRGLDMGYVMAVKHDHTVTLGPRATTARKAVRLIPNRGWQRIRTGTKGVRSYDWAMLAITPDDTPGDRGRVRRPAGAPAPLHPRTVLLPLLHHRPGAAGPPGCHRNPPLEDRNRPQLPPPATDGARRRNRREADRRPGSLGSVSDMAS